MSTIILGAGLIGTATAYYLAQAGEEVLVVERQAEAGRETSFANGGLVTPSMSDPWAAPGLPLKMLKWLGDEQAPFLLRPRALFGLMGWGLRFLANCNERSWRRNARTVLRLATYSSRALDALTTEAGLDYDRNDDGTLRIFRDELSMTAAQRSAELLSGYGVAHRVLDGAGCIEVEPALAPVADKIAGAILFPDDRSGDAFKFTQAVAELCRQRGVTFRFDTEVRAIETTGNDVTAIVTDSGPLEAERYVLALGSYSGAMARPLGLRLPIYPVKGYSLTAPVGGWNNPPTVPVVDDGRKFAVARFGDRIRAAGTAEFTGFDLSLNPRRGRNLLDALGELYPGFAPGQEVEHWCGLRPLTPDGAPILGRSPYRNLYLNCGQGHLGWTLACGSGRVVADVMRGREPEIDLEGMTLKRYQALPG